MNAPNPQTGAHRKHAPFLVAMALLTASGLAAAGEVTLPFRGLTLNADFDVTQGSQADHVVLVTHGGLAHRNQESLTYVRWLLHESGHMAVVAGLITGSETSMQMMP